MFNVKLYDHLEALQIFFCEKVNVKELKRNFDKERNCMRQALWCSMMK
jgi:hypothetical protein